MKSLEKALAKEMVSMLRDRNDMRADIVAQLKSVSEFSDKVLTMLHDVNDMRAQVIALCEEIQGQ